MNRILLNKDDFMKLVSGEIITKGDVQIALSDIGYDIMIDIIFKNMKN